MTIVLVPDQYRTRNKLDVSIFYDNIFWQFTIP